MQNWQYESRGIKAGDLCLTQFLVTSLIEQKIASLIPLRGYYCEQRNM